LSAGGQDPELEKIPSPPRTQTPKGMPAESRAAKLRRHTRDLARATAGLRHDVESAEHELSREVLERCRVGDELTDAQTDLKKAQRSLAEVREMYKMQERELQDMRAIIESATAASTQAARRASDSAGPTSLEIKKLEGNDKQSLAAVQPSTSTTPRGRTAESCVVTAGEGSPSGMSTLNVTKSPMGFLEDSKRSGDELRNTNVCVEELKGALLQDHKPPVAEAKLWGHLQSENEKLASVIDAVSELGRHVRSPQPTGTVESNLGMPVTGKKGGPSVEERERLAVASAGLPAPAKKKAYSSVLASRPKHYKLYFV